MNAEADQKILKWHRNVDRMEVDRLNRECWGRMWGWEELEANFLVDGQMEKNASITRLMKLRTAKAKFNQL